MSEELENSRSKFHVQHSCPRLGPIPGLSPDLSSCSKARETVTTFMTMVVGIDTKSRSFSSKIRSNQLQTHIYHLVLVRGSGTQYRSRMEVQV